MKIFLVRHARAGKRSEWADADTLRPLDAKGERQARGIRETLRRASFHRICSSPALRCRQTIEGVAADHGLTLETDIRLGEDTNGRARPAAALDLLHERGKDPILLCAGRALIVGILQALGVSQDAKSELRCQKGSIWVLDLRGGRVVRAEYETPRESDLDERGASL